MSQKMVIDDEIRLTVLEALLAKGAVAPNFRQLKKITGLHAATIKASLEFLKSEGVLQGFGPKISFKKFGYCLEARTFFQIDVSKKSSLDKFLSAVSGDPHCFRLSASIGSGNWNFYGSHLYRNIESFHSNFLKTYEEKIPGFFDLVKDKQIVYTTEPVYKNASRTESVIKIIKKEKGLD